MKITVLPDKLSAALDVAAKATGRATVTPAIGHVLLEAHPDGGLTVSGTDLSTRAWLTVEAKVVEPGAVLLPPATLQDLVSVADPSEGLSIEVNAKHRAELRCGRNQIKVAGLDPETFPAATSFDDPIVDATLAAPTLAMLIRSVSHAAASDESRPVLSGVLCRAADSVLTLVTADGYRLAARSTDLDAPFDLDVVVRAKPLASLAGLLMKATSVRIQVDSRQSAILLDSEAGCWAIGLIDGQFPDWRRALKIEPKTRVVVSRAALKDATTLVRGVVSTFTHDSKSVTTSRVTLSIGESSIEARSGSTELDQEADVEMDAEVDGESVRVGLRTAFLRDALDAFDSETVLLEIENDQRPVILRDPSDPDRHAQVLMPMTLPRGS